MLFCFLPAPRRCLKALSNRAGLSAALGGSEETGISGCLPQRRALESSTAAWQQPKFREGALCYGVELGSEPKSL